MFRRKAFLHWYTGEGATNPKLVPFSGIGSPESGIQESKTRIQALEITISRPQALDPEPETLRP